LSHIWMSHVLHTGNGGIQTMRRGRGGLPSHAVRASANCSAWALLFLIDIWVVAAERARYSAKEPYIPTKWASKRKQQRALPFLMNIWLVVAERLLFFSKRAVFLRKRAILLRKTALFSLQKSPVFDVYLTGSRRTTSISLQKSPHTSPQSSHISVTKPCISAKKPFSSKSPISLQKSPIYLQKSPVSCKKALFLQENCSW